MRQGAVAALLAGLAMALGVLVANTDPPNSITSDMKFIKGRIFGSNGFLRVRRQANSTNTTTTKTTSTTQSSSRGVIYAGVKGYTCSTRFYKRYGTKCCLVPKFMDTKLMQYCQDENSRQISVDFRSTAINKNIRIKQRRSFRNQTILISTNKICQASCAFKNERWLTADHLVDTRLMYDGMEKRMPADYTNLLRHAVSQCLYVAYTDPKDYITNVFGTYCYLTPLKLIRCIKRYMWIRCPSFITQNDGTRCQNDETILKKCDPLYL